MLHPFLSQFARPVPDWRLNIRSVLFTQSPNYFRPRVQFLNQFTVPNPTRSPVWELDFRAGCKVVIGAPPYLFFSRSFSRHDWYIARISFLKSISLSRLSF
ncbi:hypothetical protein COLO4_20759 [Corchorus olitorius]|uniref:Uncharacterized protein n=1 Tax=Corchorus olitorius TaxID=93759 RepID=A0A1R3IX89_9ROSI|nr:hypothetical protein COLO4_20759 [Corchorus olitorius]